MRRLADEHRRVDGPWPWILPCLLQRLVGGRLNNDRLAVGGCLAFWYLYQRVKWLCPGTSGFVIDVRANTAMQGAVRLDSRSDLVHT